MQNAALGRGSFAHFTIIRQSCLWQSGLTKDKMPTTPFQTTLFLAPTQIHHQRIEQVEKDDMIH